MATANGTNPIKELLTQGQSVWQDDISRQMLMSGQLAKRIEQIGIRGVTSNPSIFQKAISAGTVYDSDIADMLGRNMDIAAVFQTLAVKDIQDACDLFRPIYDETEGQDGFVSLEVLPALARDTDATLQNARELWTAVDRPNVMIKVPGTDEGAIAVETLLTEGVNVNITLLFSIANYERVAQGYIDSLQKRQDAGQPIDRIGSVASFFVSRVDTLADKLLDEAAAKPGANLTLIESLRGKVAVANAQLAYQRFQQLFGTEQFRKLATSGAKVQRPLWASTGTKNKAYSDVLYIEKLIGPDTVNTMPIATMEAFLDHGKVGRTVDAAFGEAQAVADGLAKVGISLDELTRQLEGEGIDTFITSYDDLLEGVEGKRAEVAEAVSSS